MSDFKNKLIELCTNELENIRKENSSDGLFYVVKPTQLMDLNNIVNIVELFPLKDLMSITYMIDESDFMEFLKSDLGLDIFLKFFEDPDLLSENLSESSDEIIEYLEKNERFLKLCKEKILDSEYREILLFNLSEKCFKSLTDGNEDYYEALKKNFKRLLISYVINLINGSMEIEFDYSMDEDMKNKCLQNREKINTLKKMIKEEDFNGFDDPEFIRELFVYYNIETVDRYFDIKKELLKAIDKNIVTEKEKREFFTEIILKNHREDSLKFIEDLLGNRIKDFKIKSDFLVEDSESYKLNSSSVCRQLSNVDKNNIKNYILLSFLYQGSNRLNKYFDKYSIKDLSSDVYALVIIESYSVQVSSIISHIVRSDAILKDNSYKEKDALLEVWKENQADKNNIYNFNKKYFNYSFSFLKRALRENDCDKIDYLFERLEKHLSILGTTLNLRECISDVVLFDDSKFEKDEIESLQNKIKKHKNIYFQSVGEEECQDM